MAARLVLFAVRHASLLRPLPQAGKLQLAKASCCSWGSFLAWRGVTWGAQFRSLHCVHCAFMAAPGKVLCLWWLVAVSCTG